jgi:hypothetical protein
VLSDGRTHTVAISVFNADSYFLVTANLLVYTDRWSPIVHGDVLENTLELPSPVVTQNISGGPEYTGTVDVTSDRQFKIRGYIRTSHGRVETSIEGSVQFASDQTFDVSPAKEIQDLVLTNKVRRRTTTREGFIAVENENVLSFPLTLKYSFIVHPDNTSTQTVKVDQENEMRTNQGGFRSFARERVHSEDTLNFTPTFALSGSPSGSSSASYRSRDLFGRCYNETLKSVDQKLTAVHRNTDCHE